MKQTIIEVDLKQAESRFVAYDGPVPKLMQMYAEGIDVHKVVASHPLLFNKPLDAITKMERQLGKKTGHAANYGMGGATLADSCLKEMNLVLSVQKAEQMLAGYHDSLEGGVLRWQKKIEEEVRRSKKLITPFGRVRYFYDRIGHDLFKEAYAYRPQSTVPDIINHLMLWLFGWGSVTLLNQVHDALWLECPDAKVGETLSRIKDQDGWNPKLKLAGGELRIPIEIKLGKNLKDMEVAFEG